MRNYQEDIPPWKKEVLMRGDGLSKAVENESITSSEENINNSSHQNSKVNQPTRFRIGSSSSFMSKVKNFFVEAKDKEENNNEPKMDEKHSSGMFVLSLLLAKEKYIK